MVLDKMGILIFSAEKHIAFLLPLNINISEYVHDVLPDMKLPGHKFQPKLVRSDTP